MNFTFSSCDKKLPEPSLSCGTSVTGETPAGACTKRFTARPAESEQPGTEINSLQTSWTAPFFSKSLKIHGKGSEEMKSL